MASTAASVHCIAAALNMAATYGRFPNQWVPHGPSADTQQSFLGILPIHADCVKIPDIDSIATANYRELVQWFAQRGWSMGLREFPPTKFGVGSILDVLSLWTKPGDRNKADWDGHKYDVANMNDDHHVQFHQAAPQFRQKLSQRGNASENLVVAFGTQRPGEIICMMMLANAPKTIFDLFNVTHGARTEMERSPISTPHGKRLTFPMVDLAVDTDISWIEGMRSAGPCQFFKGDPAEIDQAVQKNRLRINHLGARAESATAMTFMLGAAAPKNEPLRYIIDQPFLFWIERQGIAEPLFYAYVDRTDWKDPGDITRTPRS